MIGFLPGSASTSNPDLTRNERETYPMSSDKTVETVSAEIAAAIEMADAKTKVVEAIDWASIVSADDAFKALADAGIKITNASDYGDGFKVIDDKNKLVGVPFVSVMARIANGSFGDFSILHGREIGRASCRERV